MKKLVELSLNLFTSSKMLDGHWDAIDDFMRTESNELPGREKFQTAVNWWMIRWFFEVVCCLYRTMCNGMSACILCTQLTHTHARVDNIHMRLLSYTHKYEQTIPIYLPLQLIHLCFGMICCCFECVFIQLAVLSFVEIWMF